MLEYKNIANIIPSLKVKFAKLKPNCSLITWDNENTLYSCESATNEIKINMCLPYHRDDAKDCILLRVYDLCRDRVILSKNIEYKFNDIDGMAEEIIDVGTSVHSVNELRLFVADIVNADLSPHELIGGESKDNSVLLRDYFNEVHEYQIAQAAIVRKSQELQELQRKLEECKKNRNQKITSFFKQLKNEFIQNRVNCHKLIWHSPVCYFDDDCRSDELYASPSASDIYIIISENDMHSRSLSFKVRIGGARNRKFKDFDVYCKNAAHLRSIIEEKIQEFNSSELGE